MKKVLVVGAGFSGAVIARLLAEAGYPVTILESRPYVGGNCYTARDNETNIMVHVHGSHIFHTDNIRVWNFVRKYGDFVSFNCRVKATTQNSVFSLPINLLTINQFFRKTFNPTQAQEFLSSLADNSIADPISFEDQALKFLGRELYEAFFLGYPLKQWGIHPRELPASVLKRLPVRFSYDDNYYFHHYQGMPREGYTEVIKNILHHSNIDLKLNCKFKKSDGEAFDHVFYSGMIDEYFDYSLGRLPYRTLTFDISRHSGDYQGCAIMSYPELEFPFTRIVEHKHFAPWEAHTHTIIHKEYSHDAKSGDIPYYPIRLVQEETTLTEFVKLAEQEHSISFVGRLGTYRYLDMDVSINEAIMAAEEFIRLDRIGEKVPVFFQPPVK